MSTHSPISFVKKHRQFFAVLFLIVFLSMIFMYVEPASFVEKIGVRNIYLVTFFLGIIGGVSALTATGFYATVFALALGGANPFLLALFAAPGVFLGDLIFWYVGHKGKAVAEHVFGSKLEHISEWFSQKPSWFIPVGTYLYTAFTPLPGDFLMLTFSFAGIRLRRIIIPTLLGNYTIAFLVAASATYGIDYAQ